MRIAIIEDDPNWQQLLKDAFSNLGCQQILTLSDTSIATLAQVLSFEPQILILDIALEISTSGLDFAKKIAESAIADSVSLFFLTHQDDPRLHEEAYSINMPVANFLEKPHFLEGKALRRAQEILRIAAKNKPSVISINGEKVKLSDIMWVSTSEHRTLRIRLRNRTLYYAGKLLDIPSIEGKVLQGHLIKVHRKSLINMAHVKRMTHPERRIYYFHFVDDNSKEEMMIKANEKEGSFWYEQFSR
jgi:DNA-binding response OmpR family regulator